MSNLYVVKVKIDEIIDILLLHPETEAPPENYRELAEYLMRFKLQNSQNPLESIFSMINTFEINRELLEEEPEKTGGESFGDEEEYIALEMQGMLDEMKYSTLTPVEYRVFLGLAMQIKKEVGGNALKFLTTMQDTLETLGFSTPQVMEVMGKHLNPDSWRFQSGFKAIEDLTNWLQRTTNL
jgi:hypothetical protein